MPIYNPTIIYTTLEISPVITGDYTVTSDDEIILCDVSGGDVTITLPLHQSIMPIMSTGLHIMLCLR